MEGNPDVEVGFEFLISARTHAHVGIGSPEERTRLAWTLTSPDGIRVTYRGKDEFWRLFHCH